MSSIHDSCEFEFILLSDSESESECDFDLDFYNQQPICNNDDDITDIINRLARLSLHHE
jgi:hypothetical protein